MKCFIEVKDRVIIRHFQGEIRFEDIVASWEKVFADYKNLQDYLGIVSVFLGSDVIHEDANLNVLVEYLKCHLDRLKDLKIAIVMDTPLVTNTIIMGQRMKHLQIKPFATEEAALEWVHL
jgi:hypothetical protein